MTSPPSSKPRLGRPSDTRWGVMTAKSVDGRRALSWSDGQWAGTPAWVAEAQVIAAAGLVLWVPGAYGAHVEASTAGSLAAYAILDAVAGPGVCITGDIPVGEVTALRDLVEAGPVNDANDATT